MPPAVIPKVVCPAVGINAHTPAAGCMRIPVSPVTPLPVTATELPTGAWYITIVVPVGMVNWLNPEARAVNTLDPIGVGISMVTLVCTAPVP